MLRIIVLVNYNVSDFLMHDSLCVYHSVCFDHLLVCHFSPFGECDGLRISSVRCWTWYKKIKIGQQHLEG